MQTVKYHRHRSKSGLANEATRSEQRVSKPGITLDALDDALRRIDDVLRRIEDELHRKMEERFGDRRIHGVKIQWGSARLFASSRSWFDVIRGVRNASSLTSRQ